MPDNTPSFLKVIVVSILIIGALFLVRSIVLTIFNQEIESRDGIIRGLSTEIDEVRNETRDRLNNNSIYTTNEITEIKKVNSNMAESISGINNTLYNHKHRLYNGEIITKGAK
jgi:predicted PurR-regulated permease PerM